MHLRIGYKPYPPTEAIESGCKVGWRTYKKLKDAKKCSEAAKHNAVIDAGLGYDFGYCMPGSIDKTDDGYRVCIP